MINLLIVDGHNPNYTLFPKINFDKMYTCINCGVEVAMLYRRYSPSVLKVLKCVSLIVNN